MVQRYNWIRVVTSNYMLLFGTIHSELLCVSIQRWACLCPFPRMHSSAGRRGCKPVVREGGVGATFAELWPEWGSRSRGEREPLGLLRAWLASASLKADFGRGAINEVRFVWWLPGLKGLQLTAVFDFLQSFKKELQYPYISRGS